MWRYQQWMITAGRAESHGLVIQSLETKVDDHGPWMTEESPLIEGFHLGGETGGAYLSDYPASFNRGGLWLGRGFNGWTRSSAAYENDWVGFRLGVLASASQNLAFDLDTSGLSNQPLASRDGAYIDTPQRRGTDTYLSLALDQVQAQVKVGPGRLWVGNENLVFGPSVFNPLLLSSQARGIPQVGLGVDPIETLIGTFEAKVLYGKLTTSSWWDPSNTDSDRFFGGLFLGYRPSFFPELTLGAGRTVISRWSNWDSKDVICLFETDASNESGTLGLGERHQHAGLTFQLRFPSVGFETYGEWVKNDYSPWPLYFINPDHQQAYNLGAKKTFDLPWDGLFGIGVEMAILSQSKESLINANGYGLAGEFYSGWGQAFRAGYTNDGMVLGASAGNGAEAQYLYMDVYYPHWHVGYVLRRLASSVSSLYLPPLTNITYRERNNSVEFENAVTVDYRWTLWMVSLELAKGTTYNRNMVPGNEISNTRVQLRVTMSL